MPLIDVTAVAGTFSDEPELIENLTAAVMRWEQVPSLPWFVDNAAAFVHDLEPDAMSTSDGDRNYVRVEVLTPVGVLDRDKKLGVLKEMTEIVAAPPRTPASPSAPGY